MQTSYSDVFPIARAGMLADMTPRSVLSRIAEGPILQGAGVFRVPVIGAPASTPPGYPGGVWQNPNVSLAADVDAIATTVAGADAGVLLEAEDFNGVLGAAMCEPPRKMTVTTNSNAAWDADADGLVVTYYNHLGVLTSETFAVADAGNETFTTAGYCQQPVSVEFKPESMTGAAATFTVGYAALDSSLTVLDFLGVAVGDSATVESSYYVGSPAPVDSDPIYENHASVPVLAAGRIWVRTEDACVERGPVYVRIAASGANTQIGAFRSDADTASAVLVPNARWDRDSSAGGLNILVLI
jgi:hypothetical protein